MSDSEDLKDTKDIKPEEIELCSIFIKPMETYAIDKSVFIRLEMMDLRNRKIAMMEHGMSGYYLSKFCHSQVYKEMTADYTTYTTKTTI